MLEGSCHCGALALQFEPTKEPAALPVRICGCTFCTKHRPRYTSDPVGRVTIQIGADAASHYRFGLRLADFLICKTCGVFVAAYEPDRAVINVECLARAAEFTGEPVRMNVASEDSAARTARRASNWTPATIVVSRS